MTKVSERNWIQLNVALQRPDGQALPSARAVFARLTPLLRRWRQLRTVTCFFFMRKPPDLRLRFLGPNLEAQVLPDLTRILQRLKREGFVKRFFPSIYEPETFKFGGPQAMKVVHAHFDSDSRAWVDLDRIWASGQGALTPDVLTLAVLNDLFSRALADASEVWDVWCNLARLIPIPPNLQSPEAGVFFIDALLSRVTKPEACILRRYARANRTLSSGLLRVWNHGRLQCGLRAIFPFIAMFHFHRYGFDATKQGLLAQAMTQAWSPRRRLHGTEVEPARPSWELGR